MQKILTIIWKEVVVRFSSWSELIFFIILPVLFTFIFAGMQFGGGDGDNRIPVLVVNGDSSELADDLLTNLAASTTIRTELVEAAAAEERFGENDHAALLTIPAGFGEVVLAGETAVLDLQQAPNNTNGVIAAQAVQAAAGRLTQAVTAASNSVQAAEALAPFADEAARQDYFAESLALAQTAVSEAPIRLTVTRPEAAADNGFDQAAHQSAGQLLTWVFIPLLGTSGYLVYERVSGTLRRLLVTPTSKTVYLLGTIIAHLLMGLFQMALLVGFGVFVLGVNWGSSLGGLSYILFTFGVAAVAFGVMLGTIVKTESQASSVSIMTGMTMALLGGAWIPAEIFPTGVQTAVHILPTTWAMRGLSDIVLRGQGLADVLLEGGVLIGFAILFFVIGVWRFRFE
ncbi:MAG: ABC transporter permease [Chloroflexota bacterium]